MNAEGGVFGVHALPGDALHLELKHQNGEEIDYNGIKEIYDSFMEDNIISIDIEEDNKHAHTHFGPLMGDIDVKE